MIVALLILCGLLAWWAIYQDRWYKKKVAKKASEEYLRGFNEGIKTSKTFDVRAFVDSKFQNFKEKR